jgi:hypothetical protein
MRRAGTRRGAARRLCAVVCGNGLGHYRRVAGVLAALVRRTPGVEIDLYAEAWQWRAAPIDAGPAPLRVHHEPMTGGPRWDATTWSVDAYEAWLARLGAEEPVRRAQLVLSDNLAGVLRIRPDAVLMGSFLWHDVVAGAGMGDAEVLAAEHDLLARHRPPMLCVEEMAMPALTRLTTAVGLPWFCERARGRTEISGPPRRVLLMGGATGVVDDALRAVAGVVAERTELELTAPARLVDGESRLRERVRPFAFSDAELARCDVVVGRAGMGTLTDCVRHGLPILCFGDEPNAELQHNARRVEELGIGAAVALDDPESTAALLAGGIPGERYDAWRRTLAARPTGGTERAADALADHLDPVPA